METKDELKYYSILMQLALNELMAGRTFYTGYFKGADWNNLSRADRAICILSYQNNQYLGEPDGFEKIKDHIKTILNGDANK